MTGSEKGPAHKVIPIKEAAALMGMDENYLRLMMRKKRINIGPVFKNSKGTGYRYKAYEHLVNRWIDEGGNRPD